MNMIAVTSETFIEISQLIIYQVVLFTMLHNGRKTILCKEKKEKKMRIEPLTIVLFNLNVYTV